VLYFVDESGHDLKLAPCAVLSGISVPEARLWTFARRFTDLKEELLRLPTPDEYEAKGSKLLTRRVFAHAASVDDFGSDERGVLIDELHSKNATGENVSRLHLAALAQAKLEFVRASLDLAAEFEMRVFLSIVPRDAPQQRDDSFLRKDFAYLFQRVYCHVCEQRQGEQGILVFDELDPHLCHRLLGQIRRYFGETTRGQERAERVIPLPFFVHSDLTPPIQLADIIGYIANWGLRMPRMSEPAREELKPFADKVFGLRFSGRESTRSRLRIGERIWGVAYIPDLRPRAELDPELQEA
jgi:hypothetical protein